MKCTPTSFSITKMSAQEILKYWSEAIDNIAQTNDVITIAGVIKDANNIFINNAFVEIMDENFSPIMHGFSNEEGIYMLNVPLHSKYNMLVSATGKKNLYSESFEINNNEPKILDFDLEDDENSENFIIAGTIIESENMNKHIGSAIITLNNIDTNLKEQLIDVTYSNEFGEFVFLEVNPGIYNIAISAEGYLNKVIEKEVFLNESINSLIIKLEKDEKLTTGSISGIIKDFNNNPILNTDVILYNIDENNLANPVAVTKSNEKGMYLFVNIPKGNYKVMCK